MSNLGARVGAAAFVVGLSLAGPQAAGLASADTTDTAPSPSSETAPRGHAGPARSAAHADRGRRANTGRPAASTTKARNASPAATATAPKSAAIPNSVHSQPLKVAAAPQPSAPEIAAATAATPSAVAPVASAIAEPRQSAAAAASAAATAAGGSGCAACWGRDAPTIGAHINTVINHLFNSSFNWLSTLPGGPVSELLEGALVLVRRSLFLSPEGVTATQSGTSLTIDVNTGSVAYFRQNGSTIQVSGDPRFWGAKTFDATGVNDVAVSNSPGNAGCAGLFVDSGTVVATLTTSQIDSIRFGSDARFTGEVTATVTGGPLFLRDAVRSLDNVTLNAAVVLTNDVEVDAGGGAAKKDVTFGGTVDATKAGKQSLTVTALGTTTFAAAVGGQTALGSLLTRGIAPLNIPQSAETKTIPLHYLPEFSTNGQPQVKYGIDVAIGDNASQVYEFDTGGVSFFAGYNPNYWKNVPLTTTPISEGYSSGIYYDGVVANTNITLGQGSQTVSTGQLIQIAAILAGGNGTTSFDFTNPDAPPVEDHFFGDFGASFATTPVPGQSTPMANPLFQLPGNLSSGFLVQLGPIGIDPQLSVGVTDALRAQFPYAVPVTPQPSGGTYPVSGYDILSWFGFSPEYKANGVQIGETTSLLSLIDSGAPSTGIRMKDKGGYPFSSTGTVPGQLITGTTFTAKFPTLPGYTPLEWTFEAGDNGSVDKVDYESGASGGPQNVNTGLNLYNQYDVMFDVAEQVIWMRPTGGQSTVNLLSVTTTGAQTYQQNATLSGIYTAGGDFSVAGVTTLAGSTVVNAGNVRFSGTVDAAKNGEQSLVVNSSGATEFVRAVGSLQELDSLTTDAGGSTSTSMVQTTESQIYNDPVSLNGQYTVGGGSFTAAGPATLTGPVAVTGGDITFASTIDSVPNRGYSLSLTPGNGKTATLTGNAGLTNPLGGLVITAPDQSTATVTASGYVALAGDLGYSTKNGLTIGPNVTATFDKGGLIRNFANGDGVVIGTTPASTITVVDPVISGFTISGNGGAGINAMGTNGGRFTSNAIFNNGGTGVVIDGGVHNQILTNSIWSNGGDTGRGIELVAGGNNGQPAPVVDSAVLNPANSSLTVTFTLDPLPAGESTAQVFYTPASPAQGQQWLDTLSLKTDTTVTKTITVSSAVVAGGYVTVTVTTANGDTSKFSTGVAVS